MTRYRWRDLNNFTPKEVSIREVKDFKAGIFYRVYEEYNNCSVHPLTDANVFDLDDVRIDESGHPRMVHWYSVFGYDKMLTVNSFGTKSRGFDINYFQNVTDDHSIILGISVVETLDSSGTPIWEFPASLEFYKTKVIFSVIIVTNKLIRF